MNTFKTTIANVRVKRLPTFDEHFDNTNRLIEIHSEHLTPATETEALMLRALIDAYWHPIEKEFQQMASTKHA